MNPPLVEKYMYLALDEARKNFITLSGGPFGACIVKNGHVLAVARNTVLENDATCHAEINAIRIASKELGSFDLSGSVIYSTTEPCPMCFTAIHWAHIDAIVYGTSIQDAQKLGFNELPISNNTLKELGKSSVCIVSSFMFEECLQLFNDWSCLKGKQIY